jgi:hypothetical protein
MNYRLFLILLVFITKPVFSQVFEASGNLDPELSFGEPGEDDPPGTPSRHQVLVTFGGMQSQLKMRFCPPARMLMTTENGKEYSSGYAETYDPETGVLSSFEVYQDFANSFARVWIEEASEARILVRLRAALVADTGFPPTIAHRTDFSGVPYNNGYGDWVEESYYVYPDATRTRYATIYTAHANNSKPFGLEDGDRTPPNYVHEFMEAIVWTWNDDQPLDDLNVEALTLVNLEALTHTVNYTNYPLYPDGFGPGEDWNIMRINLNSEWKPFVIGRANDVTMRPYDAETETNPFQSWGGDNGGYVTALGHMVNWTHYDRTDTTLSQLYLEGLSNTTDPGTDLSDLANSWIDPPAITVNDIGFEILDDGYSEIERAYQVDRIEGAELSLTLQGSSLQPIVNPAFVFHNWSDSQIESVLINGSVLSPNQDYFQGFEADKLILFLFYESAASTEIEISTTDRVTSIPNPMDGPEIILYPNPVADNKIRIKATDHDFNRLTITDLTGRTLLAKRINTADEHIEINIEFLNKGIYHINLTGNRGSYSNKIIVQ